ncbi:hypothetical protein TNCV_2431771 [Trichonephila clavipes]|nr:hypothetical protein TNCV_2431771 [Trichonephila clavipes]
MSVFVIRPHVIVGLPCKACVPFCINPSIPIFTRDWLLMTPPTSCFNVYKKKTRLDVSHQSMLHFSTRWTKSMLFQSTFPQPCDARDAARETRRLGICRSAGTRP